MRFALLVTWMAGAAMPAGVRPCGEAIGYYSPSFAKLWVKPEDVDALNELLGARVVGGGRWRFPVPTKLRRYDASRDGGAGGAEAKEGEAQVVIGADQMEIWNERTGKRLTEEEWIELVRTSSPALRDLVRLERDAACFSRAAKGEVSCDGFDFGAGPFWVRFEFPDGASNCRRESARRLCWAQWRFTVLRRECRDAQCRQCGAEQRVYSFQCLEE